MTNPRLALLAVALLAGTITAASAQTPDATVPAESPPPAHRPFHTRPHHAASADQVEQHITRVHDQLKITAAQSAQWTAFAQVMRDNAKHMNGLYQGRTQVAGTMNAVDSLKSYEQIAEAHLQDLQKLEPAFEALYNTMDDTQKHIADRMFRNNPGK